MLYARKGSVTACRYVFVLFRDDPTTMYLPRIFWTLDEAKRTVKRDWQPDVLNTWDGGDGWIIAQVEIEDDYIVRRQKG